jgi:hypothetical protein
MGLRATLLAVVWAASAAGCAGFFGLPETVPPPEPAAPAEEPVADTPPPAPAPPADPAVAAARVAEELAAFAARETAGFTRDKREKKDFRGDLADPRAARVPVRRGRCYKLLLVAEPPADVPASWLPPTVELAWKGAAVQPPLVLATTQSNGGFATPETCPFAAGQLAVRWQEPSAPDRIAVGPYRLEVWSRAIPARELQTQEDAALAERHGAACRACREEAAQCLTSGRPGCQRGFAACLRREGVPPKLCD